VPEELRGQNDGEKGKRGMGEWGKGEREMVKGEWESVAVKMDRWRGRKEVRSMLLKR